MTTVERLDDRRAPAEPDAAARRDARRVWQYGVVLVLCTAALSASPFLAVPTAIAYAGFAGMLVVRHARAPRRLVRFLWIPAFALLLECGALSLPHGIDAVLSPWSLIYAGLFGPAYAAGVVVQLLLMPSTAPPVAAERLDPIGAADRPGVAETGSIFQAGDRRAIVVFGVGFACFAANWVSVFLSFLLIPLFALTAVTALRGSGPRVSRLLLAITVGFGVAWAGIPLCSERAPDDAASGRYVGDPHGDWLAAHYASDDIYETRIVAGFPLMLIQGNGGGGAAESLPLVKGLSALLVNFVLCTAAGLALALLAPARSLGTLVVIGVVASTAAGLRGWWELLVMLD